MRCGGQPRGRSTLPPKDSFSMRSWPQRGQWPSGPTAVGLHLRRQDGHLNQVTPSPRSGVILMQASLTRRMELLMLAIPEVIIAGLDLLGFLGAGSV